MVKDRAAHGAPGSSRRAFSTCHQRAKGRRRLGDPAARSSSRRASSATGRTRGFWHVERSRALLAEPRPDCRSASTTRRDRPARCYRGGPSSASTCAIQRQSRASHEGVRAKPAARRRPRCAALERIDVEPSPSARQKALEDRSGVSATASVQSTATYPYGAQDVSTSATRSAVIRTGLDGPSIFSTQPESARAFVLVLSWNPRGFCRRTAPPGLGAMDRMSRGKLIRAVPLWPSGD